MQSAAAVREERHAGPFDDSRLALYVHWPFCLAKCPYCDFNSHVRSGIDQARWCAALCRELDHFAAMTSGRVVTSIFFGGGTPSLMPPATVAAIIDRAAERWTMAPGAEITLEANPTSVEAARFAGFRDAGVNRVSLGVQALDDAALRFLGRGHTAAEALAAVATARRWFDRYSFDLIYARPDQTAMAWRDELRQALHHADSHLSVYQLTIEEGTAFHARHRRGELAGPDDDTGAALYEVTQEMLGDAGMPAYEISNHARPGQECRHNLTYWRYDDYVGIGAGAHGRLTTPDGRIGTRTHRAPEAWLDRVERRGHGAHPPQPIDADTALAERLMMGLRMTEGIPLANLKREPGGDAWLANPALERLVAGGFLAIDETTLRTTPAGRQRLNAVLAALL